MGGQVDHEWDFWDEANIRCASYNSEIDHDFLAVLREIHAENYCDDIAKKLSLPSQYVELIQSIFCSMDWCEYGTSPRACFIDPSLNGEELIAKLEAYIKREYPDE